MEEYQPLISVIIPCYNQAAYLHRCLESLQKQAYPYWEAWVINDGSADNTEELAKAWGEKDSRIRLVNKPNGGLSSARNAGLEQVKGNYIQFLDADDWITEDKFSTAVKAWQNNAQAVVVSDFITYEENTGLYKKAYCDLSAVKIDFKSLLYGWDLEYTIPIHCGLFPADFFISFRFDETLKAKEDWLMWLTVFRTHQPRVVYINTSQAIYRAFPGSMSKQKRSMYENTFRVFDRIRTNWPDTETLGLLCRKISEYSRRELELQENELNSFRYSRYFTIKRKLAAWAGKWILRK